MPSASNDTDWKSFSDGTLAVIQRTGRHHSVWNITAAARRMGEVAIGPNGRQGMTTATAVKIAEQYLSSGYFTPRTPRIPPGTPDAA